MIFSCSKIILFVLFVASSLLFHCAEPHDDNPTKTTSIKRRLIIRDGLNASTITSESSNKVELDDSAITQISSSDITNPIAQVIVGILIGIVGMIIGVGCSFYCLRKQGYVHPSEGVVKGIRAIPKDFEKHKLGSEQNLQHQQKASKASPLPLYYSGESEDDSSFKNEQIIITQHGPAIDLSESAEIFQDLSPNSQTIYGSQHASTSMVDLASPNLPISGGGQEMTRSRSR